MKSLFRHHLPVMLSLALAFSAFSVMAAEKQAPETFITPSETAQSGKKIELEHQVRAMENAIGKFKDMGVGVAPFEQSLQNIKGMINEGRIGDAKWQLDRLNYSLADQQKRFYADKMQSWHCDRRRAIAERVRAFNTSEAAAGLSLSAHSTLSRKKSTGIIIYPIAR